MRTILSIMPTLSREYDLHFKPFCNVPLNPANGGALGSAQAGSAISGTDGEGGGAGDDAGVREADGDGGGNGDGAMGSGSMGNIVNNGGSVGGGETDGESEKNRTSKLPEFRGCR